MYVLTCKISISWLSVAPVAQVRSACPDSTSLALSDGNQHLQQAFQLELNIISLNSIWLFKIEFKASLVLTLSQKRWHLLVVWSLTGWLSLLSGQAAVLLSPKSRGVSHWKIVWAPSIFGLYSSFRSTQPVHLFINWSGVFSFAGNFGSPGGNILGGPQTDSGFGS